MRALVLVVFVAGGLAYECPAHADHRLLWLADLYRGDTIRIHPFGQHGRLRRREWLELTRFFRDRKGHRHAVEPGLLRVLAQVQRHFGGRQLHLMSGYRAPDDAQALSSYHQVGHAADLWIDGVSNRDLFGDLWPEVGNGGARGGLDPRCGPAALRDAAVVLGEAAARQARLNYLEDARLQTELMSQLRR